MTSYLTPKDAAAMDCPVAKIHAEPQRKCRADGCMFWRWRPLSVTPEWARKFEAAAKEYHEANGGKLSAAKEHVGQHLAGFGLAESPTEGWCGMAGEPKA